MNRGQRCFKIINNAQTDLSLCRRMEKQRNHKCPNSWTSCLLIFCLCLLLVNPTRSQNLGVQWGCLWNSFPKCWHWGFLERKGDQTRPNPQLSVSPGLPQTAGQVVSGPRLLSLSSLLLLLLLFLMFAVRMRAGNGMGVGAFSRLQKEKERRMPEESSTMLPKCGFS